MKKNNACIVTLRKNRLLDSETEVRDFDQALSELDCTFATPEEIEQLFLVFTDTCEQHEVMWGLFHAVEAIDDEKELPALVEALPATRHEASEWAELLHIRILNSEATKEKYRNLIKTLSAKKKNAVKKVLHQLRDNDPDFASRVEYVLS
jgi:hypothetical protein